MSAMKVPPVKTRQGMTFQMTRLGKFRESGNRHVSLPWIFFVSLQDV